MQHELKTANTKARLAASLKKLMEQKPLSRITVSEIITDCGVNRKTFYYHFEDIYALVRWIIDDEVVNVLKKIDILATPDDALRLVINYIDSNKHLLCCIYDTVGQKEMKRFFKSDFMWITQTIVKNVAKDNSVELSEGFAEFISLFYAEALAGLLIDYFYSTEKQNREELISNVFFVLKHSIPNVIKTKGMQTP